MSRAPSLSLGALALLAACADPAEQPRVSVEVTQLSTATSMRGGSIGGIGVELLFTPVGDAGASRPHRRIAPVSVEDTLALTVQVPPGTYRLSALVTGNVACPGGAVQTPTLGRSTSDAMITVPATSTSPARLAITRVDPGMLCM